MDPRTTPAFLRGMTQSRSVTRRDAFRLAGLSAAGLALSACGVQGRKAAPPKKDAVADYWASKQKNGTLRFANWPLYIDKDGKKYPSLELFTADTGIKVTYAEAIQEMPVFFGKIQPQLAAGNDIGHDLMVMTNSIQLNRAIQLGYLVPLDHSRLPNFAANAGARFKNPVWDPGNAYTVPWAGGITGIAYNPEYVDEVTSIEDLWNPKYKGKVGMMSDTQEVANFGMFALGVDPDTSTEADWRRAGDRLRRQRDAGLVRKYYENDYIEALVRGDVWITMAWSGDVFQQVAEGKDLRFVVPAEGGTIWTDNLCIPKTAQNPVDALTLMDYVYQPKIAAMLVEYINYIAPVPATKDILAAKAAGEKGEDKEFLEQVATSPMIYPSDADMAKLRSYTVLSTAQEKVFEGIFQPITQG
ncbi:spermidine/putrescine ABC transporter substrate-binding protein [Planomonospora sp. ID82291]|uniref:polyamine ABC transporter substrate-binding protein n=1 Tax=Planomonospora sp. ID82291 TaxID=2738136 RepID=UPI0018C422DB|nr:spermidine/putrescine ABC transporter substrate-binding protein [Planomonospora sp. ID82291]MBG0812861.1 spermidine/putrescine ABC transporter substrate-binding protein [Planomonospora sp. ID82291]